MKVELRPVFLAAVVAYIGAGFELLLGVFVAAAAVVLVVAAVKSWGCPLDDHGLQSLTCCLWLG